MPRPRKRLTSTGLLPGASNERRRHVVDRCPARSARPVHGGHRRSGSQRVVRVTGDLTRWPVGAPSPIWGLSPGGPSGTTVMGPVCEAGPCQHLLKPPIARRENGAWCRAWAGRRDPTGETLPSRFPSHETPRSLPAVTPGAHAGADCGSAELAQLGAKCSLSIP